MDLRAISNWLDDIGSFCMYMMIHVVRKSGIIVIVDDNLLILDALFKCFVLWHIFQTMNFQGKVDRLGSLF